LATTRNKTDAADRARPAEAGREPSRRRRTSLRHTFCAGIEAGVKAEPAAFQSTKPRSMLGLMVRELVCAAGRGRCEAIKAVMGFLDEADARRNAGDSEGARSQGNSGTEEPAEPRWEWDDDGAWDSSEREAADAKSARGTDEQFAVPDAPVAARMFERIMRSHKSDRLNAERLVRLATEREGRKAPPGEAPISGNIPDEPALDPLSPAIRIGGRIVDG
jgi:hypothetical protein